MKMFLEMRALTIFSNGSENQNKTEIMQKLRAILLKPLKILTIPRYASVFPPIVDLKQMCLFTLH